MSTSRLAPLVIALFLFPAPGAYGQVGTSCLRPLAIPDRWVENQTKPWDSSDTFDPTGPNPDVYADGFDVAADQGRVLPLSLLNTLRFDGSQPVVGADSALAVRVGNGGGGAVYREHFEACSGVLHRTGEVLVREQGNLAGPSRQALETLIASDPNATWDPTANGGAGGVVGSSYAQSPRIIALPVYAPDAGAIAISHDLTVVKIVGYFVSHLEPTLVHGYLTGWSSLDASDVVATAGRTARLSARVRGPGSPIAGLPVEFRLNDVVAGTSETVDGEIAHLPVSLSTLMPGTHAIRARLAPAAGFFISDDAAATLTVTPQPLEAPLLAASSSGSTMSISWTARPRAHPRRRSSSRLDRPPALGISSTRTWD